MGFKPVFRSGEEDGASYGPSPVIDSAWAETCWCKLKDSTSLQAQGQGKEKQGGMSRWSRDPAMLLRGPAAELWHLEVPTATLVLLFIVLVAQLVLRSNPGLAHPLPELSQKPRWGEDRGQMLSTEKKPIQFSFVRNFGFRSILHHSLSYQEKSRYHKAYTQLPFWG